MKPLAPRRLCAVLAALTLCMTLSGCLQRGGAERTVNRFCKAVQTLDFDVATPLMSDPDAALTNALKNAVDFSGRRNEADLMQLWHLCAKKIEFNIISASQTSSGSEDTTEISVQFDYPDLYGILNDYERENTVSPGEAVTDEIKRLGKNSIYWLFDQPAETVSAKKTQDFLDWAANALLKGNYRVLPATVSFECVRTGRRWSVSSVSGDSLLRILDFGFESATVAKPEDAVEAFCVALRTMNYDAIMSLTDDPNSALIAALRNAVAFVERTRTFRIARLYCEKIDFKIATSEKLDDGMKISVEFRYPDLNDALQNYMRANPASFEGGVEEIKRYGRNAIHWLFEEPMEESALLNCLDWIETALRDGHYADTHVTVLFQCVRNGNEWNLSFASESENSLLQMLSFGLDG